MGAEDVLKAAESWFLRWIDVAHDVDGLIVKIVKDIAYWQCPFILILISSYFYDI